MAKEYIFGQMGENMMENGKMEDNMVEVSMFPKQDSTERDNGNKVKE